MPKSVTVNLSQIKGPSEFESLCCQILNHEYEDRNINFQPYGRQGQKQYGADLFAHIVTKNEDSYIVAQCKYYDENSTNPYQRLQNEICNDIQHAQVKWETMKKFIIMTSLKRDNQTQDLFNQLSSKFHVPIDCYFGEDISKILCSNEGHFLGDKNKAPIGLLNELSGYATFLMNSLISDTFDQLMRNIHQNFVPPELYPFCKGICGGISCLWKTSIHSYIQLNHYSTEIMNTINGLHELILTNDKLAVNEEDDGTGIAELITVRRYQLYFSDANHKEQLVQHCNKIIELCTQIRIQ